MLPRRSEARNIPNRLFTIESTGVQSLGDHSQETGDRRPVTPLKRAVAWVLLVAGFGIWLVSDTLFPGNSRLYDAIAAGDARVVRDLLKAGADPNSQASPLTLRRTSTRRYQMSPLAFALWNKQADAAEALVEAGANPNARDLNGHTALFLAKQSHMSQVEQLLAARGATLTKTEQPLADR
jgi:ankyrin repeat protein